MSFSFQANNKNKNLSTPPMPNPITSSDSSTLPIDMVEVVIDQTSNARLNACSSDSSPGEEVEVIFDLSESADSVDCSQEERLRREIKAMRYGLQSLINCQVSDQVKFNLSGELNELRRIFELFLNRYLQGRITSDLLCYY